MIDSELYNLKKQLKHQLDLEFELVDLIHELLNKIYKDKASSAICAFNESYNFFEMNGCLGMYAFKDIKESE